MKQMLIRLLIVVLLALGLTVDAAAEPVAVSMKTTLGEMQLELYPEQAPESVKNFLRYVDEGFYNGTVFHRVINGFMIQGGGFTADLERKTTHDAIRNEARNGLKNVRGTIAMARTSAPHSATSQFFINHADNNNLDYPGLDGWGYAVFGRVTAGMETVDKIADVFTATRNGMANVPEEAVTIESVNRISTSK
ncbi:MAG: peptidyl-prolyl cis-trans isomerase [Gammaproteobacteria bacterium]|nr:peptidyl-prolyl cis-trans isomerase [Gammaproteobacteria bacterium]MCB1863421.1 peptidyl-prolyl cis-trans isomerase [Gammaproteobacteria bacterium]MCB1880776.1 peptidyl-prolyl cis-trans isomerase [Gammaproteobacteria bacterium]MCB1904606.1 peptidyl-prolyl cis-trans isomerase [Gammaproteobacteria bacterium]